MLVNKTETANTKMGEAVDGGFESDTSFFLFHLVSGDVDCYWILMSGGGGSSGGYLNSSHCSVGRKTPGPVTQHHHGLMPGSNRHQGPRRPALAAPRSDLHISGHVGVIPVLLGHLHGSYRSLETLKPSTSSPLTSAYGTCRRKGRR